MSIETNVSLDILRAARAAAEQMIDDGRAIERKGQEALRHVVSAERRRRERYERGQCGACGVEIEGGFLTAEDGVPDHIDCPKLPDEPKPEPCPACKPTPGAVNHVPGHIFVGWGMGWQRCHVCDGTGRAP